MLAKDILSEIDDALDFKLSVLMAEGPAEELQLTQNAQPAFLQVQSAHCAFCRNRPEKLSLIYAVMLLAILWANIQHYVQLAVWALQKQRAFCTFVASPCSRQFLWVRGHGRFDWC